MSENILENEKESYLSLIENKNSVGGNSEKCLSEIYCLLNDPKMSLEYLDNAFNNGWYEYRQISSSPYFNLIKDDPMYSLIDDMMKTKVDSIKTSLQDEFSNVCLRLY